MTGLLECSNQAEEGQEQPDGDKQCGDLPPHPGFQTEVFAVEENDGPYGVAQDFSVRRRGGESSLVELPPSVLQPAMENTTSARLPEIPIDTDKTIPGDLAVALDAENGSNRPNSTDEALCDDRVPDL